MHGIHYYGPDSWGYYSRYKLCIVMLDSFKQLLLAPLNKSGESVIFTHTHQDLIFHIPHLQTHQQHMDIVTTVELRKA